MVSPTLPPKELDQLVAQLITNLDDADSDRCLAILLMSSYLPAESLVKFVKELLSVAQTLSRPELLTGLVLANGIARELWALNPVAAGNMIAESALVRLGGDTILTETLNAIGDVCEWWA